MYTWNFHPDLLESARRQGARGYTSKTLPARELVAALEAVHRGEVVVSDVPPRARSANGLDWVAVERQVGTGGETRVKISKLAGAVATNALTVGIGAAIVVPASAANNIKPLVSQRHWTTAPPVRR